MPWHQLLQANSGTDPRIVVSRGCFSLTTKIRVLSLVTLSLLGLLQQYQYSPMNVGLTVIRDSAAASCVGVADLGDWAFQPRTGLNWVCKHDSAAACTWRVLPITCHTGNDAITWASLSSLKNTTVTFVGDSTSREIRARLGYCLDVSLPSAVSDDDDLVAGGNITLRYSVAGFARDILAARLRLRRDHASVAELADAGAGRMQQTAALSVAMSNASYFAAYVGQFLVFGNGFWHFSRDMKANSHNQDNGGHEKFDTREQAAAHYITEVADVIAFVQSLVEPWRSQLKQRMLWKQMTTLEEAPRSPLKSDLPRSKNPHLLVEMGNRAVCAMWEAVGVRVLRIHKYTVVGNVSSFPASGLPQFTRDGVHLHDAPHLLVLRELLASLVDAQARISISRTSNRS